MVHLFARLTGLLARVSRSSTLIIEAEASSSAQSTFDQPTLSNNYHIMSTEDLIQSIVDPIDPLIAEARQLNHDVDSWIESLQLVSLEHERVQVGNRAYAHAMKVRRLFFWTQTMVKADNTCRYSSYGGYSDTLERIAEFRMPLLRYYDIARLLRRC